MQNIFASNESPAAILRNTMTVSLNGNGEPIVSFSVNRGKGSGGQQILVSEFAEYIAILEEVLEEGIPEVEAVEMTAAEMVRHTIRNDNGVISFRVRGGKGAKPAKVPASDFAEVVELLRSTLDAVEGAATSMVG